MKNRRKYFFLFLVLLLTTITVIYYFNYASGPPEIVSVKFNPKRVNLSFYLRNAGGDLYRNIGGLKSELERQNSNLIFAMNGGMFNPSLQPIGLYIENGKIIKSLNTAVNNPENKDPSNFNLEPNGVFYITSENVAHICKSSSFLIDTEVKFATQSGPMLVIEGKINKIFNPNSGNFYVRNGVGVLSNNELIFAVSKNKVTFYDFAKYFKDLGCSNALFLDGGISKAYMPELGIRQLDGQLGVLIGISEKKHSYDK
jgi:uncharacterized protein YigE (DUF2233 family)